MMLMLHVMMEAVHIVFMDAHTLGHVTTMLMQLVMMVHVKLLLVVQIVWLATMILL